MQHGDSSGSCSQATSWQSTAAHPQQEGQTAVPVGYVRGALTPQALRLRQPHDDRGQRGQAAVDGASLAQLAALRASCGDALGPWEQMVWCVGWAAMYRTTYRARGLLCGLQLS